MAKVYNIDNAACYFLMKTYREKNLTTKGIKRGSRLPSGRVFSPKELMKWESQIRMLKDMNQ